MTGLKEADALGVPWLHDAYGYCEYCTTRWKTLYESQHNTGYSVNDGHAEYAIVTVPYVGHLRARSVFVAMAPILCAGVMSYKDIKETEAKHNEWIVISDLVANAATEDVVANVAKGTNGDAHGVLVTAVSPSAFGQGIAMTRRRGTVSLLGSPAGEFPTRFSTLCSSASPCAAPSPARQGSQRGNRLRSRWQAECSSGGWTTSSISSRR